MSNENEFFIAVSKRENDVKNARNKQLVMRCATMLSMTKNSDLLRKLDVKATDFSERQNHADKFCVYSLNQATLLLSAITKLTDSASLLDLSETVYACLRTVMNFKNEKRNFSMNDLYACIDRTAKISDDKKALIYRKRELHELDYAKRQATIAINVFRVLKLVKHENRYEFSVNNNAATQAIAKMLTK